MYHKHVTQASEFVRALLDENDAWDDEELSDEILRTESIDYCLDNGLWDVENGELTPEATMMVAGNSREIFSSYNGRYRKDSLNELAFKAFRKDIILHLLKDKPDWEFIDPCARGE